MEEGRPSGNRSTWEIREVSLDTRGLHTKECAGHVDATTHLGNGLARVPMKVVTSCDKLRGDA